MKFLRDKFGAVFYIFLSIVAIIPFLLFTTFCIWLFETELVPEYKRKAWTVGVGVVERVEYALNAGVPFDDLRGMGRFLDDVKASGEDLAFIAVAGANGAKFYSTSHSPEGLSQISTSAAPPSSSAALASDEPAQEYFSDTSRLLGSFFSRLFKVNDTNAQTIAHHTFQKFFVTILPITYQKSVIGQVYVGVDQGIIQAIITELFYDTGTIFLAALIIAIEFVLILVSVHLLRPISLLAFLAQRLKQKDFRNVVAIETRGAAADVVSNVTNFMTVTSERARNLFKKLPGLPLHPTTKDIRRRAETLLSSYRLPPQEGPEPLRFPALLYIRLPLFLFFLAEAIIRPILPMYVNDLAAAPQGGATSDLVGIPFAAFMAATVATVTLGSILAERISTRFVLICGTLLSIIGLALSPYANDILTISILRALSGMGYGLVYAAAQIYVVQHSDKTRQAGGFSVFLAAVVAAEICGPPIGGVIADRLGDGATFQFAALLLAISIGFILMLINRHAPNLSEAFKDTPANSEKTSSGAWRALRLLASSPRFLMVTLFYAIPSKLLLTGAIYLIIPIAATQLGATSAEIGRILMVYGLAIFLTGSLFARLADKSKAYGFYVAAGGFLSGLGLLSVIYDPGVLTLTLAVLFVGLGQSLSIPSQLSFTLSVSTGPDKTVSAGTVLAGFRLIERLGSLFGPLVATWLLSVGDFETALMWMGVYAICSTSVASAYFLIFGSKDEELAVHDLLIQTDASSATSTERS